MEQISESENNQVTVLLETNKMGSYDWVIRFKLVSINSWD